MDNIHQQQGDTVRSNTIPGLEFITNSETYVNDGLPTGMYKSECQCQCKGQMIYYNDRDSTSVFKVTIKYL